MACACTTDSRTGRVDDLHDPRSGDVKVALTGWMFVAPGEQATVMVKPGSDLYRFLSRQRGRKVKIVLTEAAATELSRIER